MSCTELAAANEDGKLVTAAQFRNAWGGAAFVWTALARKYKIGVNRNGLWGNPAVYESDMPTFDTWGEVWKYAEDGKPLLAYEKNVLYSTFDNAVVARDGMLPLAQSLRLFKQEHHKAGVVCSLGDQADSIEQLYAKGVQWIAWNQTSVSEEWYTSYDEETDTSSPYCVLTGTTHTLYEMLPL
jgi:hypothetical protein